MGFFKKVFGSAVEEVKKNLEDSKNEMLKNLEDKKNEMLKNLNGKKDEALGYFGIKSSSAFSSDDENVRIMPEDKVSFYESVSSNHQVGQSEENPSSKGASQKTIAGHKTASTEEAKQAQMKLWWVDDLELLYNGDKYALNYTGNKKKTTDYVYDDVAMLNEYQARLAQKQADGSILYGIACTCGWSFLLTNCEYTKVTFLDGIGAVLAIDEDGDEYAIDRFGAPYALEVYKEMVEEDMNDNE